MIVIYKILQYVTLHENWSYFYIEISGELSNSNEVLGWLIHQMKNDEIEEVTDEMLKMLVEDNPHVAVLFCGPY